jgi:allantoinase
MKPSPTGPFPYSPIVSRPRLGWPGDAKVAVWVIPNIEFFALDEQVVTSPGKVPNVPTYCARDYGVRVGVWRVMDVLDRHQLRATVALNSKVCDYYPQIIEAGMQRGWEWMGHNQTNTRHLNTVPPEEERGVIFSTLDDIERITGKRPVGWLGAGLNETWNTLDYLVEAGCSYVADWVNDDQPYFMDVAGRKLVSVPYTYELNDFPAFQEKRQTPEEFEATIRRQFDVLYAEGAVSGRVLAIALHPFIIGLPHRIGALDSALAYIRSHDAVWFATGDEIATHYSRTAGGDNQ